MIDVSFCKDGVGVGKRNAEKRLFYFGDFSRYSPGGAGRRLYTPPVYPCTLQRTRIDCTTQAVPDTRQTAHSRPHTDTHARTLERLRSVSETEQIWTRSNMNDFQHKNVCKTIDTNTRMCYYIDNTRTCYTTTTKQEDKSHEKDL